MEEQARTWPAEEDALEIHARLCADDPVASSDLAIAYLDPLANWLQRKNPGLDPHLCQQAAEDAIISLIKRPHSFKPDMSPLHAYLRMAAQGDLRNALERERRHSSRRENLEVVEQRGAGGNLVHEGDDPALLAEREDERETAMRAIPFDVEQMFTPDERQVIALMVEGERRTEAYARVLGISAQPEQAQRQEVKRIKDRIKRRMQRARSRT